MPLVDIRGLGKTYVMGNNQVHALRDVTFSIEQGEFWSIVGTSGSGKSTLLNLLGCLDRPTRGSYRLAGKEVGDMEDAELSDIRGGMLGFVFQSFNLIPQLNVVENIEVPLFYRNVPTREARRRAMALAERVGLGDRAGHRPTELSGGQQQRVAIARALVNDPVLILADEPTGNLDTRTGLEIMALLNELHQAGSTIVMVTHELEVADFAQKVMTVRDGNIQEIRQGLHRAAEALK